LKQKFPYKQSFQSSGTTPAMGSTRFLPIPKPALKQYKMEVEDELHRILSWWMGMTVDTVHGGFIGKMDHDNKIFSKAPKGSVLNSRILWAFSAACNASKKKEYLAIAERAFTYIVEHFIDKEYGGVYWIVDYAGKPLETKKQIYSLAFLIYGMAEFFKASANEHAKQIAIDLYRAVCKNSYDCEFGGYVEALTRDWKQLDDLRLSEKDANEKKSMNTHLHMLEAFTALYRIWRDDDLRKKIFELVRIFKDRIIDPSTYRLGLFFDEHWNSRSNIVSYGHDIEAAWLLTEAAESIGDEDLLVEVNAVSVKMASAVVEGLDSDGGLWYEYDRDQRHLTKQKHSWPQAEAMVGFFNAWTLTFDERLLTHSIRAWHFVKDYIIDENLGEWYWGVHEDHSPMLKEEKVGIWKCPYHNTRACLEISRRVDNILNSTK